MHFEGFEDFNTFYCIVSACTTFYLEALAPSTNGSSVGF